MTPIGDVLDAGLRQRIEAMVELSKQRDAERAAERARLEADPVWRAEQAKRHEARVLDVMGRRGFPVEVVRTMAWGQVDDRERIGFQRWLELSPPRQWIVVIGAVGVGKTYCLCLAGRELLERGEDARWVHAGALFDDLGKYHGRDEAEIDPGWQYAGTLFVDDLGAEQPPGDLARGRFETLLNDRHANGRCTVLSTNATSLDFVADRYGWAVSSRLRDKERVLRVLWRADKDRRTGETHWREAAA